MKTPLVFVHEIFLHFLSFKDISSYFSLREKKQEISFRKKKAGILAKAGKGGIPVVYIFTHFMFNLGNMNNHDIKNYIVI